MTFMPDQFPNPQIISLFLRRSAGAGVPCSCLIWFFQKRSHPSSHTDSHLGLQTSRAQQG